MAPRAHKAAAVRCCRSSDNHVLHLEMEKTELDKNYKRVSEQKAAYMCCIDTRHLLHYSHVSDLDISILNHVC